MTPSTTQPARRQFLVIALIVVLALVAGTFLLRSGPPKAAGEAHAEAGHGKHEEEDAHGHGEEEAGHTEEAAKGPHGGQKLVDGTLALELLLAEEGGEPRFKAWLFDKEQALAANAASLALTLTRPGGDEQQIGFAAQGDTLVSTSEIAEPHNFEARITAQVPGAVHHFAFSQEEGKVAMTDAQIKAASITLESAGASVIRSALQLPGEIRFDEDRTAHIVPRVAGVVERVSANLGQAVKKDEVLAVISSMAISEQRSELQSAQKRLQLAQTTYVREQKLFDEKISPEQDVLQARQALSEAEIAVANAGQKLKAIGAESADGNLSRYALRAPFDGMIVEKHIALGESVKEDANVFILSDLRSVWAELNIGAKDLQEVRVGGPVIVRATAFDAKASGVISYVGSLIGEQTRTAKARVTLPNPDGAWRPGLFVTVELVSAEAPAPVTVATDAIHSDGDKSIVFLRVPGGFVPQAVEVGRSDGKRTEIVRGLKAGTAYAAAGSFVVKAEQGKGTASHAH